MIGKIHVYLDIAVYIFKIFLLLRLAGFLTEGVGSQLWFLTLAVTVALFWEIVSSITLNVPQVQAEVRKFNDFFKQVGKK